MISNFEEGAQEISGIHYIFTPCSVIYTNIFDFKALLKLAKFWFVSLIVNMILIYQKEKKTGCHYLFSTVLLHFCL